MASKTTNGTDPMHPDRVTTVRIWVVVGRPRSSPGAAGGHPAAPPVGGTPQRSWATQESHRSSRSAGRCECRVVERANGRLMCHSRWPSARTEREEPSALIRPAVLAICGHRLPPDWCNVFSSMRCHLDIDAMSSRRRAKEIAALRTPARMRLDGGYGYRAADEGRRNGARSATSPTAAPHRRSRPAGTGRSRTIPGSTTSAPPLHPQRGRGELAQATGSAGQPHS
jgi:hypothetical protein